MKLARSNACCWLLEGFWGSGRRKCHKGGAFLRDPNRRSWDRSLGLSGLLCMPHAVPTKQQEQNKHKLSPTSCFCDNFNLIILVDVQRLQENGKWISYVFLLSLKSFFAAPLCFKIISFTAVILDSPWWNNSSNA